MNIKYFFSTLFQALFGKKYRKHPDSAVMDKAEQRAIHAGLINSEQIMAYCDSYTTGLTDVRLVEGLGSYWDICSPEQAHERLAWLSQDGHRFLYDIIFRVYSEGALENSGQRVLSALIDSGRYGSPKFVLEQFSAEASSEVKHKVYSAFESAMSLLENFKSVFRTLQDKVNGQYLLKDYEAGILAWDLGRLVTVARMSFDRGYIAKLELCRILVRVDSEMQENFSSWSQFAKSYIIGRASWSGQNNTLDVIISIAEDLMTDEDSPWVLSSQLSIH